MFFSDMVFKYVNRTEKWFFMRYLFKRLYFHPAKFDNFKDEKISDYKIVSVAQSKYLLY